MVKILVDTEMYREYRMDPVVPDNDIETKIQVWILPTYFDIFYYYGYYTSDFQISDTKNHCRFQVFKP